MKKRHSNTDMKNIHRGDLEEVLRYQTNSGRWLNYNIAICKEKDHDIDLRYVPVVNDDEGKYKGIKVAIANCATCKHEYWTFLGIRNEI